MTTATSVDIQRIRTDHALTEAAAETAAWEPHRGRMGVSWHQGYRAGWWDAVTWVLETQAGWEGLTEAEAILELGKGAGSVYWPLFRDDPRIFADCPRDGRITVSAEGTCDRCLFDFLR